MTRLPHWAWRPWLTPWHAALAWWHRPRPVKIPHRRKDHS